MSKYPHPIFRHYLEGEDDKPYYTMNSLAFYYEDMERKQKLIESLAKSIAGYDIRLNENLESIEQQVAEKFTAWDLQTETLPATVTDLVETWVTNGTIDTIIEDARLNLKTDKVEFNEFVNDTTAQLAETGHIKGTRQIPTFDENGTLLRVRHVDENGQALRTDTFLYTSISIEETRTLHGGSSVTFIHNLETLETEVI